MKKIIVVTIKLLLFITACNNSLPVSTLTPMANPPITEDAAIDELTKTPTATTIATQTLDSTPAPQAVREKRPTTFRIIDNRELVTSAEYLYRSDIQYPAGMTWGPDGYMYIADHNGDRIVRMSPSGQVEDLELWKYHLPWTDGHVSGPIDVAFSPDSTLYFADDVGIFRVTNSTSLEKLLAVFPQGSISSLAINDNGELYYSTWVNRGCIEEYTQEKQSSIFCDSGYIEDMVFDSNGRLIVSVGGKVIRIDLDSNNVIQIADQGGYLAVDSDGNIWIRGGYPDVLSCYSQDGVKKSFSITDKRYPLNIFITTSAAMAIDDEDRIWVGSYNSHIVRLDPVKPESAIPAFDIITLFPSLEPRAIEVDSHGDVYVFNARTFELWEFSEPGSYQVIGSNYENHFLAVGANREVGLEIDDEGNIFLGFPDGEVIKIDPDGVESHYAWLSTASMTITVNGSLYALAQTGGGKRTIVNITGVDTYQTILSLIAGDAIGSGQSGNNNGDWGAYIEAAPNGGIYVFALGSGKVYYSDLQGIEYVVTTFASPDIGIFTASPSGDIFYSLHTFSEALGGGEVMRITLPQPQDGSGHDDQIKVRQSNVWSIIEGLIDPWAMAVSPDGRYLYIGDSGTVIKLGLSE